MKLKYQIYFKELAGKWTGVAMGSDARKYNNVIILNESGYDIAKHLQEEISREELIDRVAQEYEDSREVIAAQVDTVIAKLQDEGIL